MDEVRKTNASSHPLIVATWNARLVNQAVGFGLIAPWEAGELTDEWLDVFRGLREVDKEHAAEARAKAEFDAKVARERAGKR